MARFSRLSVLNTIVEDGLMPVFYHPDVEVATEVALACHRGGLRSFEFTNRGDRAHRVFEDLCARLADEAPDQILGVGSIGDPHTAALYLAAGANFVVGPILDAEVARLCNGRKVSYSPGCGSPTEIATAEELGCELIKVFPGVSVGGPSFVSAVLGPRPWTTLMPTGGVEPTLDGLRVWFEAGVAAVGIGLKMITKDILENRDWTQLEEDVRRVLGWIREIRSAK